jgi:hypothetical protein
VIVNKPVIGIVLLLLTSACGSLPDPAGLVVVSGRLVAGPVCPVETDPPSPECAPRPVGGATVMIEVEGGDAVSVVSDPEGRFQASVVAGNIRVTPQPVEGLLGTPAPIELEAGGGSLDLGELAYDTGIR